MATELGFSLRRLLCLLRAAPSCGCYIGAVYASAPQRQVQTYERTALIKAGVFACCLLTLFWSGDLRSRPASRRS